MTLLKAFKSGQTGIASDRSLLPSHEDTVSVHLAGANTIGFLPLLSLLLLLPLLFTVPITASAQSSPDKNASGSQPLQLWYNRPAQYWQEALPLGNATTGAMVFGGVQKARYQLNDHNLWSGEPVDGNNPNGPKLLPIIRKLIFAGNYDSAATLYRKMQGPYSARYLPLADLWLYNGNGQHQKTTKNYLRSLDLTSAISHVQYEENGIHFKRESFISYPDQVMVIRITADKPRAISLKIGLTSLLRNKLQVRSSKAGEEMLLLKGKAPSYVANRAYEKHQVVYDHPADGPDPFGGKGMTFSVMTRLSASGGQLSSTDSLLEISGADTLTIYLTEATSYSGFDKSPSEAGLDDEKIARTRMASAIAKSYATLKANHLKDYQHLFGRVKFWIDNAAGTSLRQDSAAIQLAKATGENTADIWPKGLPTDLRLKNFAHDGGDHMLQVLYYQYGRYLLISSSRPGSLPANLQGIWNDMVQPPWGSNYTTNINTEMNYWPAENTNLSECATPLFDFTRAMAVNGAKTAKVNYGIETGWLAHHNSDAWAKTSPTGGFDKDPKGTPRWSAWVMAGAWMSTHLWEHYLYTGDRNFLKKDAYPTMKGAAAFLLQWLVTDPKTGYLVTNPSTSPENTVKIDGKEYELTLGSTMDMSIIRAIFTDVIKAADLLDIDQSFSNRLKKAKDKLYPFHIGRNGQLQEWYGDWDDPKDKHRHISHLFGLYPGAQITPAATPLLAKAARETLRERGDLSTGWSMAWKVNWWARLNDGEHAYKILQDAFRFIDPASSKAEMSGGGTYPNLLDAHPPFQIDGNFGATAGMTEMLLQSHDGVITFLPALPREWQHGAISGIKARGNFEVDIAWEKAKLTHAKIKSLLGGPCRILTTIPVKVLNKDGQPLARGRSTAGTENQPLYNWFGDQGKPPVVISKKGKDKEVKEQLAADGNAGNNGNSKPDKGYYTDFVTQKGAVYTVVPL
ncbi:MAG TPA: glycoside hydrolase family 95 protein [Arachidicoccus sp.]|nr:glycoside hydrolase family 95 protein [Arachidicoccus sp.]